MFDKQNLITQMHIDGQEISHFLSFSLYQSFNAHHRFELRIEHGRLGMPGLVNLNDYRDFIGRKLILSFGQEQASLQNFRGLVTDVSLSQSHGYQGVVVIKGHSSSILIDRGKDIGSYHDRTLRDIVQQATRDAGQEGVYMQINPARSKPVDYMIQYKESDFEFLNRLSAEYYEWFYYDGEQLCFGKPAELPRCKITYGREIRQLDYGLHISPVRLRRFSYLPQHDELVESDSAAKVNGLPDHAFAVDRAKELFSKTYSEPTRIRVDSVGDLREIVRAEEEARVGQLLRISGQSDSAALRIGGEVEIETSVRQDLSFVTDALGNFLITQIEHHFDDQGRYSNSFSGVQAVTERLPVADCTAPHPEMQMADVTDNNDPLGQGRVRVRFKWRCQTNDDSEWLRVVTPNAGTGDRGVNRGYLSVPEIGDHVMVAFEEGHVSRPVVIGSLYNQKTVDSSPMIKNHLKTITTRSGHLIEFDDDEGSQGIKITDIRGNIMHIDTKGDNITITALENMTLNCKNMQINVGENMDVQVGKDKSESVGMNTTESVGMNKTESVGMAKMTSVLGDASMFITGKLTEFIDGDVHSETMKGKTVINVDQGIEINSKASITKNAQQEVQNNSGEKSKFY